MKRDGNVWREGISKTKACAVAAVAIVVLSIAVVPGVIAAGPQGDLSFVSTPRAISQQNAGYCDRPGAAGPVCKEICLQTMDGHILPQGDFVCLPEDP